jgi:hypothetical protein
MSPALREVCADVQRLLGNARRDSSEARYQIGRFVEAIRCGPGKYGTRGVALLADAVGKSRHALYGYALVARRWTAEEFATLSSRRDIHGVPLTFAHFTILGRIALSHRRQLLLERCLSDGLSVRELRTLTKAPSESVRGGAAAPTLLRVLAVSRATAKIAGSVEALVRDVRDRPITTRLESQLASIVQHFRDLTEASSSIANSFEKELAAVREKLTRASQQAAS